MLPALRLSTLLVIAACGVNAAVAADRRMTEDYVRVAMPPDFHVEPTEMDGPVFANGQGKTLYVWPFRRMRNGLTGDAKGKTACGDKPYIETAGLMSPYPPGLELPDLDMRPACTDMWIPVLAGANDQPVGDWSFITRSDGTKQWSYNEQALYTSNFDRRPGDVLGDTSRRGGGDSPAARRPIGPPPNVPPGFSVITQTSGRILTTNEGYSVYFSDRDSAKASLCKGACAEKWAPILAPDVAQPQGQWTIMERTPGVKQWVFRGKPVYRHSLDTYRGSVEGGDEAGWHNFYTQKAPEPPPGFTVQTTTVGYVLADSRGRSIYIYNCGDDSFDQLRCDHPDTTQAYRMAMCGAGDPARCLKTWPMIPADPNAKSGSQVWSVVAIDPKTGKRATADQADAMYVWAFRERPVYTFAGDKQPGDVNGDGRGEWRGGRNGFRAFMLRDDFLGNTD
ncbi:MAG: hypothetical protein AB7I36_20175 [Rhodospirillaceae bacterium]